MIKDSIPIFAVTDVTRTIEHYCNVLGFAKRWDWGEPPTFGCVGLGAMELFLCADAKLAAGVEGYQHYFGVEDVEALHAQHVAAGAQIISPLENKPWGNREYTVRDLNGYHLRFAGPQKYEKPATARDAMPPNIRIDVEMPTLDEYVSLFESVSWSINRLTMTEALQRSLFAVLARDSERQGEAVGIVRLTGDGRNFMIWDVIVRPSHQGMKIGAAMMERALAELRKTAPAGAFVGLFTGKPEFYQRLGFKTDGGMHLTL